MSWQRVLFFAAFLAIIAAGGRALAQGTGVIRVIPVVEGGAVAVSFAADGAVTSEAQELLHSGLLLTLSFVIDLKRPSSTWWDRTVQRVLVSSTVKFDNLTGLYHVSRSEGGHVTWSERTRDLAEVRRWLSFEKVPLASDGQLEPNAEYYVDVRMTLSPRRTFPLWPFGGDDGAGRADFTFIR